MDDTIDTNAATAGEINMAIITGTWLASVYDAGSTLMLGKYIGISIPSAQSNAEIVMIFTLFVDVILITFFILSAASCHDSCLVS